MNTSEEWSDVARLLDAARAANQRGDRDQVEAMIQAARAAHQQERSAPTPLERALLDERFGSGRQVVFS